MEYGKMAKYYDLFYKDKDYNKEINFITDLINDRKTILDVGCGTGIHMHLLESIGYEVDGIDLSKDMLDIADSRVNGKVYQGNLLYYKINKKYDVIISMFAVFNHLKSYEELERGIINSYNHLKDNGILIIDLHNGRSNGEKETNYNDFKRIMKWQFDKEHFIEHTDIDYIIDNKIYHDMHEFKIYEIDKIKDILNKYNLKYKLYENYSFNVASDKSKNIEIVIYK